MTHLIKIGNSQGIRIPKPLIEQADLEGKDLQLQVVEGGLLISPKKSARDGWRESIKNTLETRGAESLDQEWLNAPLTTEDDWTW
ncbi:MAG: AbrB/MazE/SpoVT family DNA-binding domain-containing protein [Gammaproteobacteria bacterium]|nr:MAG: AbrB/MazE/SpoVT family DNA-binding domain-containing protein [Gammaproteobacteria bacterium]